jgi:kumamolisin
MRTARLSAGVVLGVAAIMAPLAALSGTASAATASSGSNTPVPSGINVTALPGVEVFGDTPADTPETVSFILDERNLASLEAQVQYGVRSYLSVGQFASFYGQTPANISALTSYLKSFGISTDVYADNVDVVATGTAGDFDKALSVQQRQYYVPPQGGNSQVGSIPGQYVHGIKQSPLLPANLASFVLAILGLTNYGAYGSQSIHVNTSLLKPQQGSSYCLGLTGLPDACHLPQDFASNYGLDGLYSRGADGSGQTVAIVTLAALDPGPPGYHWAPQYFWANVAHIKQTGTLTVQNIDGGPGAPSDASGSGETDLDVEQSGGVAPGANVVVYQAPNTDYGFADAFFTAASQNVASTVSASWLESETYLEASILAGQEAATYAHAFDEAFLEMAVQGQSGFIASGDWGAYTAHVDLGTTNLSVGVSPDSPYITAAGGTTLPWSGTLTGPDGNATVTVPDQRIWGWDYLWQPTATVTGTPLAQVAESMVIGSGGGFSQVENATPLYQQRLTLTGSFAAVKYLTPTDYQTIVPGLVEPTAWSFNPTPGVTTGLNHGRMNPDVSADADPYTGYLLYEPSFAAVGEPVLQGGWGGTSFVAPQLNGSTAVIDSFLGHRVGFWNPVIYAAAAGPGTPFTPLNQTGTSNDNIYYTGVSGQIYNQGAGLGIPNLTRLADSFG